MAGPLTFDTRFPERPLRVRGLFSEADSDDGELSVRGLLGPRHKRLTLTRLHCAKTEDLTGADEVRIEVWLDGQFDDAIRFSLNDGRSKGLGRTYEFDDHARVLLLDEDTSEPSDFVRLDLDDILGSHRFAAVETGSRRYSGDGAEYRLDVEVAEAPGEAESAASLLADFRASTEGGVWPEVDRQALLDQVAARVSHPWLIDQGPSNTCGPAAVVYELARRSPRRYVRLVRSLYETGRFRLKSGRMIRTTRDLRSAPPRQVTEDGDTRSLPEADWVVLSALRQSANIFKGDAESFDSGGSTHWEVAGWLWDLCGYNRIDYFPGPPGMVANVLSPFDTKAEKWLSKANEVLGRNGAAIASVDTDILGRRVLGWWSVPKHLVALVNRSVEFRSTDPADPAAAAALAKVRPLQVGTKGFVGWSAFTWGDIDRETTSRKVFESGMWLLIMGH